MRDLTLQSRFLSRKAASHIDSVRAVLIFTESVEPLYLFVLAAFPDAKPFHTFAGNALAATSA
jgi:hypothetical protein